MTEAKKVYRVERTELHTRVWFITAVSEAEALASYLDTDDDEHHAFHSGHPDVKIDWIGRERSDDCHSAFTHK